MFAPHNGPRTSVRHEESLLDFPNINNDGAYPSPQHKLHKFVQRRRGSGGAGHKRNYSGGGDYQNHAFTAPGSPPSNDYEQNNKRTRSPKTQSASPYKPETPELAHVQSGPVDLTFLSSITSEQWRHIRCDPPTLEDGEDSGLDDYDRDTTNPSILGEEERYKTTFNSGRESHPDIDPDQKPPARFNDNHIRTGSFIRQNDEEEPKEEEEDETPIEDSDFDPPLRYHHQLQKGKSPAPRSNPVPFTWKQTDPHTNPLKHTSAVTTPPIGPPQHLYSNLSTTFNTKKPSTLPTRPGTTAATTTTARPTTGVPDDSFPPATPDTTLNLLTIDDILSLPSTQENMSQRVSYFRSLPHSEWASQGEIILNRQREVGTQMAEERENRARMVREFEQELEQRAEAVEDRMGRSKFYMARLRSSFGLLL